MNRQRIGQVLFWIGVVSVIIMQLLTWIQSPMQRIHTAEELMDTIYSTSGILWWVRMAAASGLTLSIMGVLLYSGSKGSLFWLLGFLPGTAISIGMFWTPSQYMPQLFGIGGTIILLSYFGILWFWTRTFAAYEGIARTGRHIQILGYSFIVSAAFLLCLHFGNPHLLALASYPIPGGESINITLSVGMLLIFVGEYLVAKNRK